MPDHYGTDGCAYEHRGDAIAQPDPPEYPAEWNSEQRLTAYWYALGYSIIASSTAAWHGILHAAERTSERRHTKISTLIAPPPVQAVPDDEVPF